MTNIEWNEKMSVQIKSIDIQHQSLVAAINDFYESIAEKSSKDVMLDLLKKMKDYSLFHFSAEEALLKKHAYPEFDKHKREHQSFIEKINDLDKRLKEGKLVVSLEITSFIKSWLTSHIMVEDKKYTAHLHAKGVT